MAKVLSVLIVDDNEDDGLLMVRQIEQDGYDVISERVETAETMKAALERVEWDVVLIDYAMPYFSGPDALTLAREMEPDMPCIIVSGTMGEDIAVAMMRAGANDYLMKDNLNRLTPAIEREMGDAVVRRMRKQAEEQSKRLMQAIEQAMEAIIITDADGTIQYVNPAFGSITGYTRAETVGQNPRILKSDRQDDAFYKEMWDTLVRGQTWSGEIINKKKNGTLYTEETTISPVHDAEGKTTNYVSVKRDITERKQIESEREQLLKNLSAKNKELQSIVYIASHDLKSPLVNIVGFDGELSKSCQELQALMQNTDPDTDKKAKIENLLEEQIPESLAYINAGINKIQMLLDGLLQVSRIGTAKTKILPLDMNDLFGNIVESTQFKSKEYGATITIDDLPGCQSDLIKTSQVFSNLIDNALKYLDHDRPGKIHISGWTDERTSTYCVEDNGMGIKADYTDKIFELFHRLAPNDSVGGEGLGLSIVMRILDRLDGHIRVESEPGAGSKFFVSLPTG